MVVRCLKRLICLKNHPCLLLLCLVAACFLFAKKLVIDGHNGDTIASDSKYNQVTSILVTVLVEVATYGLQVPVSLPVGSGSWYRPLTRLKN